MLLPERRRSLILKLESLVLRSVTRAPIIEENSDDATRRDRLLLVNALAVVLLTLLGAAGESLGLDRLLKSNTSKRRTHSLFRQGCLLYDLIPNMPEHRLTPLIAKYAELLSQNSVFNETFGWV